MEKMLLSIHENQPEENIVVSPYSILTALCALSDGTAGIAREEIIDFLTPFLSENGQLRDQTQDFDALKRVFLELSKSQGEEDNGIDETFQSNNALCLRKKNAAKVNAEFKTAFKEQYDGEVFCGNDLVPEVNSWVSERTKGLIPEILDQSAADMEACLVNAISFICGWADPYETTNIRKNRNFTCADGTKAKVTMLNSIENQYTETEDYQAFAKFYAEPRFSFVAVLPKKKEKETPTEQMERVLHKTDFREVFRSMNFERVCVTMPEFKTEYGTNLTASLKEMGIRRAFAEGADFSPMYTGDFRVEGVVHRASISVNRKGTEAAAATGCVIIAGAPPEGKPVKKMVLSRPFLYAVMDLKSGMPIFEGVLNSIEEAQTDIPGDDTDKTEKRYSQSDAEKLVEERINAVCRAVSEEDAGYEFRDIDFDSTAVLEVDKNTMPFSDMHLFVCSSDNEAKDLFSGKKAGMYERREKSEDAVWGELPCCDAFMHTFLGRKDNLVIEITLVESAGIMTNEQRDSGHKEYLKQKRKLNSLVRKIME